MEKETYAICKTKEGTIWDTTSSATILEAIFQHTNRMGIQTQQPRQMCHEQNN